MIDKLKFWVQSTLPLVYDDSISFYELVNKVVFKLNEVINSQNELLNEWNNFISQFDTNLYETVNNILTEWFNNGKFDDIIKGHMLSWYNVMSYGAIPDGKTDCLPILKNIIATERPGILYFPGADNGYFLSDYFNIPSNWTLLGDGYNSYIFSTNSNAAGHLLGVVGLNPTQTLCKTYEPAKNIVISNLRVNIYDTGYDNNSIGITIADNIIIDRIFVDNCDWKGVTAQNFCNNIEIKNCNISNCKNGGVTIEGYTETETQEDINNVYIHNNTFNIVKDYQAITVTSARSKNIIKNVVIENCDFIDSNSITLSDVESTIIKNCYFSNPQQPINFLNTKHCGMIKCVVENSSNPITFTQLKLEEKYNYIKDSNLSFLETVPACIVTNDQMEGLLIENTVVKGGILSINVQNENITLTNSILEKPINAGRRFGLVNNYFEIYPLYYPNNASENDLGTIEQVSGHFSNGMLLVKGCFKILNQNTNVNLIKLPITCARTGIIVKLFTTPIETPILALANVTTDGNIALNIGTDKTYCYIECSISYNDIIYTPLTT